MLVTNEKLKELLVPPGHISEVVFEASKKEAEGSKRELSDILVAKGLIKDYQLGQLIASEFDYKFANLKSEKVDDELLTSIPELVAESRGVIAFARSEKGIKVGMINPADLEMKHFLEKSLGDKVIPYLVTRQGLAHAITRYKSGLRDEFRKIIKKLSDENLSKEERDEITVGVVDMLLQYGYESNASDIHIEPYLNHASVRFRIDGMMHDVLEVPKDLYYFIVTRIKILSKMRTDEHRAAQDGKLRFSVSGSDDVVDVRVSSVPVTEGENVVMRLLAAKNRRFSLTDIGLSGKDFEKVKRAIVNPHGMILVTGPTGSGKTTSLYAILQILNKREVHIATIEDPVEYDMEGISQIQVNTKTDLTFAKGLRSLVRQDPDIIMVGEIRDSETASIAVNSALTGHLVLSTLHTNDAATTLPRLLDMGIEPFLVASTVNVAIAQRLLRKICGRCKASYSLTSEEIKTIKNDPYLSKICHDAGHKDLNKIILYKGTGCKVCGDSGYSGRIGVFEVLEMEENIKDLILKRASSDDIAKQAKKNGMTTMLEDGMQKIFNGATTLTEVLRVTRE